MSDALPFFAMAALAWGLAAFAWVGGRIWLRAREMEREAPAPLNPNAASDLAAILARIDTRLNHLQQSVDATAIEVERLGEAERYEARALGAGETPLPFFDVRKATKH